MSGWTLPAPDRPNLAVPEGPMPKSCGCEGEDRDLVRLRDLMADGMGQVEASHRVWPSAVPAAAAVELPEAITPRPAHALNRWINREVS